MSMKSVLDVFLGAANVATAEEIREDRIASLAREYLTQDIAALKPKDRERLARIMQIIAHLPGEQWTFEEEEPDLLTQAENLAGTPEGEAKLRQAKDIDIGVDGITVKEYDP